MHRIQVHVVEGIHPTVPGRRLSVHFTKAAADQAASDMVALIAADVAGARAVPRDPTRWRQFLSDLQCLIAASAGAELTGNESEDDLAELAGFYVAIVDIETPAPRAVVSLQDGLVAGAVSDIELEMFVVDHDTDGVEPERLLTVPRDGDETSLATVRRESVHVDPDVIDQLAAAHADHELHMQNSKKVEETMDRYENDGIIVDQIIYWWDQPVVYLGRAATGDDRPCLVVLISGTGSRQVFHRLTFENELGLRRTLASGVAPTAATYDMAVCLARLETVTGEEHWQDVTLAELLLIDGPPTSLPPGRSSGHIDIAQWSDDHWALLLYLYGRSRNPGGGGLPTIEWQRLRINPQHHIVHAAAAVKCGSSFPTWSECNGTRLAGYEELAPDEDPEKARDPELQRRYHDDVDCLEEMEDEDLLHIVSTVRGEFSLTTAGISLCQQLDDHVARHGAVRGFQALHLPER
ncbi:hypothetical protein [Sphingomonas sp. 3-13AW]|uniref:hypothetical protein n=1 Tax=Sphingomonas sp. 3-13AW TaxID=3050450 RepID=UPI003BB69665